MYPWAGQPPASASLMLDRILGVTPSYTWNPQLENKGKGRVLPGFYNLAFVPTHLTTSTPSFWFALFTSLWHHLL